jgi:hypothetical protein
VQVATAGRHDAKRDELFASGKRVIRNLEQFHRK